MSVMGITQKTTSAKRREIKIISKPKWVRVNPVLRRKLRTFHLHLNMTHQYSALHTAWGATPELPFLPLWSLPRSLTSYLRHGFTGTSFPLHTAGHVVHHNSRTTITALLNNFLFVDQDATGLAFTAWLTAMLPTHLETLFIFITTLMQQGGTDW